MSFASLLLYPWCWSFWFVCLILVDIEHSWLLYISLCAPSTRRLNVFVCFGVVWLRLSVILLKKVPPSSESVSFNRCQLYISWWFPNYLFSSRMSFLCILRDIWNTRKTLPTYIMPFALYKWTFQPKVLSYRTWKFFMVLNNMLRPQISLTASRYLKWRNFQPAYEFHKCTVIFG